LIILNAYLLSAQNGGLKFSISFPEDFEKEIIDGRMLLMISTDSTAEPRFSIRGDYKSQQIFGVDVESLKKKEKVIFDNSIFGYPLKSISEINAGEYYVQALLNVYETYHLKSGHTVKLPPDRGEGQQWNLKPGNPYSTPQKVFIDPASENEINISLDKIIPPIDPPKDTKYIKHIKMKSDLLSEFWGTDVYLGANVLLPYGFDEHPEAKYPLVIFHGHFPHTFGGFRETPPDTTVKPEYSECFNMEGYNIVQQEYAYRFYKEWTGDDFPRMIIIEIQHANPYYDDSYAVNSANLGPYGDAITYELIPYIEKKFRGIGEGWARFLYGGSTGGWEALAAQIFYPDEYNGCWAACPDPIDFSAYTITNIYEDENAYFNSGSFGKIEKPGARDYLGHVKSTLIQQNHLELVLGTKSRSGQQWDIWEAVYSPAGEDGYPKRIWNKLTGEIDKSVAQYWKENYDLRFILERDWNKIGKKLEGKIHIYVGDMDNYYLNNAVYKMEDFLESTENPYYGGEVDYGDRAEHCWNGDHSLPNAFSRLRYNQMYVPKIIERIEKTAPPGADLKSWRY